MNYLQFLNEIVFTVIESVVFLLVFCILSGKKEYPPSNKTASAVFIIFYSVFTYWVAKFIPAGLHTIFILGFSVMCLSFLTKVNLYISLLIFLIISIPMFVLEFLVMIIAMLVSGYDSNVILENQAITLACTITVKLIEFVAIAILYKINFEKMHNLKIFKREIDLPALIFFQAYLFGVIITSVNYVISYPDKLTMYMVLILCIYLLYIVLVALDLKERSRLNSLKNKYALQQEHIKNIESIINLIRMEKHDFANHLNTIYGLCTLNKPDMAERIKQYIINTTGKSYLSHKSINTGNDYVDALLAVKSNEGMDKGITLKWDIPEPLSLAVIDDKELVAVLANIIDNAFDAMLAQPDNTNKYLLVSTFIENDVFHISVKNNGPAIPEKNLKKIFTDGFSTKAGNRDEHGFGLYIVKQAIDKHAGTISVASNDQETEFIIKLGVKRECHEEYCSETS